VARLSFVIAMAMTICTSTAMSVPMTAAVGAALRLEGSQPALHPQPQPQQQIRQHIIFRQAQFVCTHLQSHMTVAQVIGGAQQVEGLDGTHHQQGLRRRLHHDDGGAIGVEQPLTGPQRRSPRQLQHQISAADAAAMTPQAGAFLRAQGQPERLAGSGGA
jgi:hypothetical protein